MESNIKLNLVLGSICLVIMLALMPLAHVTSLTCIGPTHTDGQANGNSEFKVRFNETRRTASFSEQPFELASFSDREISWGYEDDSHPGFDTTWSFKLSRMTGTLEVISACVPTRDGNYCGKGHNKYQCQKDQQQF